ncbi:DUF417 family protein [Myroides phaeus]|uniref:Uncharacterized membrane protein YkgB n=1 Tax=Myroides phaeus TaxID=702745 RepID=A0A1G8DH38_9FLAO|nr:DUF417 family protein [Myroides phaeus]SDH56953.1 Uncharacterized membrane protein YkgB [Myroides phaeus]
MKLKSFSTKKHTFGYYISLWGTVLILIWVGAYKFTPTEAKAIVPLIENHPLSYWMYNVLSVQAVSIVVGIVELLVALTLVLTLKYDAFKKYAGIGLCIIFLMTISYLFTTPGVWKTVDGFPLTDFFILKDLMYLGFGISLLESTQKQTV